MHEALRCDTRQFDLAMVLQLVHTQRLTGHLSVESNATAVGIADFHAGEVTSTRCGKATDATGLLELFVMPNTQATFFVHPHPAQPPVGNLLAMIIEGCRLKDEWSQLHAVIPHRNEGNEALEPDALQDPGISVLLPELDGRCNLALAVQRAGVARCVIIDPVRALLNQGALTTAPHESDGEAPDRSTDESMPDLRFFEALESGRHHYVHGSLGEAATAFRRALQLRPDDPVARQNIHRLRELHPDLFAPRTP